LCLANSRKGRKFKREKSEVSLRESGIEIGIPVVGQNYGEKENTINFSKKNKEALWPVPHPARKHLG